MNHRERQALDRHITGNYGEAQYSDTPFLDDTSVATCCGNPWSDHDQLEVELEDGGVLVVATCPEEGPNVQPS